MKVWEQNIRRVTPYVPGEQPGERNIIKLNTNENPYPPAPGVVQAMRDFDADSLRRYPDPAVSELVHAIAEEYGLRDEQVFVGVGSDDVLAMSFLTFFNSDKPILFPDITYSFYDVWAEEFRIPYEEIPLDKEFQICVSDYERENGGIIFPNPNAPTGELMPLDVVEQMVAAHPDVVVIVDEAYIDFGGSSALPLIERYDNLLVVQTFSKSRSMAGMRIGYAMGQPQLIRYLNDVKYSFNSYTMNSLVIAMGAAAIRDRAYFEETRTRIIATRERVKRELREIGYRCGDSMSNFLFVTHDTVSMEELFRELKEQNIYVRHFDRDRIRNYLRISIGTDEEMDVLLAYLRKR
ncbi:MAG: histidinol-phosphate transaminase [Lachnospiraceae bacterium]|nr:histidinol-phosphate transaminase [Lachnospiraceae bacterium]